MAQSGSRQFDVGTFVQAVGVLYGDGAREQNVQRQAHDFLEAFQQSSEAWSVCDEVLASSSKECSLLAAQTLRRKISLQLPTLGDDGARVQLRDALIGHLLRLASVSEDASNSAQESIVTQLAVCLADLYLQTPQWNHFVVELLNRFSQAGETSRIVLALLRVFPEEVESSRLRVGENRRNTIRDELAERTDDVLRYLAHVLQSNQHSEKTVQRVIDVLGALFQNPRVKSDAFSSSSLLDALFTIMSSTTFPEQLYESATEALVSVIYRAEDLRTHGSLIQKLQQGIYSLSHVWDAAVRDEDMERLTCLTRVYVELAESLYEPLVNHPTTDTNELGCVRTVELLLQVAEHPDSSLLDMTFNVWYRLSEGLYANPETDEIVQIYKPLVARYLMAIWRHARLDENETGVPSTDSDADELRAKLSESVKDVIFTVKTDVFVATMKQELERAAREGGRWNELEATLFLISAVIHNVEPTAEDDTVSTIVRAIVSLDGASTHPALLYTAIQLLGNAVEWLHINRLFFDDALTWVLNIASHSDLCVVAAETVQKLVTTGGRRAPSCAHLAPSFLHLVATLEAAQRRGSEAEQSCVCLLQAYTATIRDAEKSTQTDRLAAVLEPQIVRLSAALDTKANAGEAHAGNNENATDSWVGLAQNPMLFVDRLSAIFRSLSPANDAIELPQPYVDLVQRAWVALSRTLTTYQHNSRMVEHACRSVRYMLRSLGLKSEIFVQDLVSMMLTIYESHSHSCLLYLTSILVDEFCGAEAVRGQLLILTKLMAKNAYKVLQRPDGFRSNPDTVEDLFRLAQRFVVRAPDLWWTDESSGELLECACCALSLDHFEAHCSVTKFLMETLKLIRTSQSTPELNWWSAASKVWRNWGERVVLSSLHASLFSVSGSLRRDLAELVFSVQNTFSQEFPQWLGAAVQSLPHGPLEASPEQLQFFHSEIVQASQLSVVVAQFRELARLYGSRR